MSDKQWSKRTSLNAQLLLLRRRSADFFKIRSGWDSQYRPGYEKVVIVKIAVHASSDFRSFGAVGWTSSAEEDYRHDAPDVGVGVGGEPPEASTGMRAGASFAKDGLFVEV